MPFKSGFVSLVGRPNVGKSSLLNALLTHKVSIVSNKAQTTRHNVRGILTVPEKYQLIFIDTPGIHRAPKLLNRQMNAAAFRSLKGANLAILLVPVNEKISGNDLQLLSDLQKKKLPFLIVISKKDLVDTETLSRKIEEWQALSPPQTVIATSIDDQKSLEHLLKLLLTFLPNTGPQYFDSKLITDQPQKQRIQDVIREAVLFKTGQEIPHNTLVLVEEIKRNQGELVVIASIIVERKSQKLIMIGHQGKKIKDIKYRARKELKNLYPKTKIKLELFVKVKNNWRNSPNLIKKEIAEKGEF